MQLSTSKTQIDKLGRRLAGPGVPTDEDLRGFHDLLGFYADSLDRTTPRILRSTGLEPTSRIKNTGTILEKLRRNKGGGLSSTQDLAGARVVGDFTARGSQDELVDRLRAEFSDAPKPTRVTDRRELPSHGYRAVHVVVYPDGVPVEIQVRSSLQQDWAERFEKFADLVGRDVRYGGSPTFPRLDAREAADPVLTFAAGRVLSSLMSLSQMIAHAESRNDDRISQLLRLRDRWVVAASFGAVEGTIDRFDSLLREVAAASQTAAAEHLASDDTLT